MLYIFGDCTFDTERCELRHTGETVTVEPKVFKVLAYLLEHRNRVVTKAELLECFWSGTFMSESALTHCLTKARKAVHDDSVSQSIIKTVRGYGYRFVATVAVSTSVPAATPIRTSRAEPMPAVSTSTPEAPHMLGARRGVPSEHQQVMVVTGLQGVTASAQAVDSEELYELLTKAANLMRGAIQGVEGWVTRRAGASLIALLGVPMAREDHLIRALQVALELQQTFAAYADTLQGQVFFFL
jgi:DNA-binding winged helix-turn-helix (wHTH) protein